MSDERKRRWVVTLNVDYAGEGLLTSEELFDPVFQRTNCTRMIWGIGDTEEDCFFDAYLLSDEVIPAKYIPNSSDRD